MEWENLLNKGMGVFAQENELNNSVNFLFNDALNLFPSYYFIFNCETSQIDYTSPDISNVLGFEPASFTIQRLLEYIHPEDHDEFIQHETKALEFCGQLAPELQEKYCVVHNFRMITKTGNSIYIQQQAYACEVKKGVLKKTMVIHSDISSLKDQNQKVLHFIGIKNAPSFYNVHLKTEAQLFTSKEQIILYYMVQGKKSEEIADLLNRSVHTIRNHRKNILQKSGCTNVQELLVKSIREAWV